MFDVSATGKNGNYLKIDYVKALNRKNQNGVLINSFCKYCYNFALYSNTILQLTKFLVINQIFIKFNVVDDIKFIILHHLFTLCMFN